MRYIIVVLLFCFGLGCGDTLSEHDEPSVSTQRSAIVNGQRELNYPAVGALAVATAVYFGASCSATLIDPQWVLTAAHCIDGAVDIAAEVGFELTPNHVNFVIANDANGTGLQGLQVPRDASLYQAAQIFIHPNYTTDETARDYDIALIRLQNSVQGVSPIPIFRDDLSTREGEMLTYVGFGTQNPFSQNPRSSGVKYRTSLAIEAVGADAYLSRHNNSGVCFGDSGGPGIIEVNGQQYVAGVNSTVTGEAENAQADCLVASTQIRVDAYQSWIDYTMGGSPNCGADIGLCSCTDACTAQGYCDNALCGELACGGLADCASSCGSDRVCQSACYVRASASAKSGLINLATCAERRCQLGTFFCLQENCPNELEMCYGDDAFPSGNLSCGDIHTCLNACRDANCVQNCYNSGTPDAQRQYSEFYDCNEEQCASLRTDYSAYNECLNNRCGAQLTACMPDERCRLLGGDCPSDRACTLEGWGSTYCRKTDGISPLESCIASRISCGDGYYCRNLGDGPRCYVNCITDSDCNGQSCRPLRGAVVDFGQCEVPCDDTDGDGYCNDEDCAPQDMTRYPGAEDVCGDGADGDCDGTVDEGCDACVDSDGDGSCDELDCAPLRIDQSPNLDEVCDDLVDNDCDTRVDENCDAPTLECADPNDPNCAPPVLFFDDENPSKSAGCACDVSDKKHSGWLWIFGLLSIGFRPKPRSVD